MPKTLLYVFETFCDDLPEKVREDDLQFMMVMLSDEDLEQVDEVGNIDEREKELDPFLLRRQRCFAVILARRKVLAVRRCIDGASAVAIASGLKVVSMLASFIRSKRETGLTSIDLPPGLTPKAIYTLTIPQNAANPNGSEPVCSISSRLKRIGSDEGAWPYVDAPAVGGPR